MFAAAYGCLAALLLFSTQSFAQEQSRERREIPVHIAAAEAELNNLFTQGRFAEALPAAEKYLAKAREHYGEASPSVAVAMMLLGAVYVELQRYAEAEPLLRRSLTLLETSRSATASDVIGALSGLRNLLHRQGRFSEMVPLVLRQVAIAEKAFGPRHREVGEHGTDRPRLRPSSDRQ